MTPRGPEHDDTPEVAVSADGYVTLDGVILARIVGFGGDSADRVVAALRSALARLADARGDDTTPSVVVNDNGAILIDGVHHGDVYSPRGRDALRAALATAAAPVPRSEQCGALDDDGVACERRHGVCDGRHWHSEEIRQGVPWHPERWWSRTTAATDPPPSLPAVLTEGARVTWSDVTDDSMVGTVLGAAAHIAWPDEGTRSFVRADRLRLACRASEDHPAEPADKEEP